MYKLVGLRKNGIEVCREYDNENVARFEFEVTMIVASRLELFKDDILIDSYSYKEPENITYLIDGQNKQGIINRRGIRDMQTAIMEFNYQKMTCDWLTMYEDKNGNRTMIECYVKVA